MSEGLREELTLYMYQPVGKVRETPEVRLPGPLAARLEEPRKLSQARSKEINE